MQFTKKPRTSFRN